MEAEAVWLWNAYSLSHGVLCLWTRDLVCLHLRSATLYTSLSARGVAMSSLGMAGHAIPGLELKVRILGEI